MPRLNSRNVAVPGSPRLEVRRRTTFAYAWRLRRNCRQPRVRAKLTRFAGDFARDQLRLDAPTGDIAACAAYMESVSASNHLLEKFMMTNKEFTHFRRAHSEQSTYMRRSSAFA